MRGGGRRLNVLHKPRLLALAVVLTAALVPQCTPGVEISEDPQQSTLLPYACWLRQRHCLDRLAAVGPESIAQNYPTQTEQHLAHHEEPIRPAGIAYGS
jgi:hypothetical protein